MKTILLIEDDPDTLDNLALMLEMEGFRTLAADNGRDGLELAQKALPDLILCDVMLPDLDGHGVIAALRADPRTAAIPVIFLTARGERHDLRTGMNLGADDYLIKPADGDDVLTAVRARLARREQVEKCTVARIEFQPDFASPEPLRVALALTPREAEVLLWVAQGKSNAEIAMILGNAERTVKLHLTHIFEKLGLENRNAAARRALEILSAPRISGEEPGAADL